MQLGARLGSRELPDGGTPLGITLGLERDGALGSVSGSDRGAQQSMQTTRPSTSQQFYKHGLLL